jgi:hypothetical protein
MNNPIQTAAASGKASASHQADVVQDGTVKVLQTAQKAPAAVEATGKHQADVAQDGTAKILQTAHRASATVEATGKHQAEVIQKSSTDAANAYHGVCASWLERRAEDMRIGLKAAKSLAECRDMTKAAEIYSGWVSENLRRLQDELSSAPKEISKLGSQYMDTLKGLTAVIPGNAETKHIN